MKELELVSDNAKGGREEVPKLSLPTGAFLAELRQRLKDKEQGGGDWGTAHKNQRYCHPIHSHLTPSHSAGQEGGEWMRVGWGGCKRSMKLNEGSLLLLLLPI